MAQIVLINSGTYRPGVNELGDIVSMHEDDIPLTHRNYSNGTFRLIKIPGLTVAQLRDRLAALTPTRSTVDGEEEWWDGSEWQPLVNPPKYRKAIAGASAGDVTILANPAITPAIRDAILDRVCVSRITS